MYNQMMNHTRDHARDHDHISTQLTDYVLGLLPAQDRLALEQHTAVCQPCRQQLQQERALAQVVRGTVTAATTPPVHLAQLMPPVPQKRPFWLTPLLPQRRVAFAALLLMLFLSSVGLRNWGTPINANANATLPAFIAATSTLEPTETKLPTSTVASVTQPTATTNEATNVPTNMATAVPNQSPVPQLSPAPNPTPIAAALFNSN